MSDRRRRGSRGTVSSAAGSASSIPPQLRLQSEAAQFAAQQLAGKHIGVADPRFQAIQREEAQRLQAAAASGGAGGSRRRRSRHNSLSGGGPGTR